MAKGGGGEGHYDERRRAAAAAAKPKRVSTGYADSPEVLAAIQKPSGVTKKPVAAVVKKKPIVKPRLKPSGIVLTTARKGNLEGEMVNSGAKQDRWFGDIVNRTAKVDQDQSVNRTAKADRDYGDIVNREAKADPFYGDIVNTAAKEDRDTGGVSPASVITAPRKYPTPDRSAKGNRGGNYTPQRDKDNAFPNISNYDLGGGLYGQGKSLLDWVKRRNSKRMLDM